VVIEVIENEEFPWHEEIKYPKSFSLELESSKLVGSYEDQYGFECDFELIELVNNGHELLLGHCGGTKHSTSWTPIHKVKMIEGRLHGLVITSNKKFEWVAERKQPHR